MKLKIIRTDNGPEFFMPQIYASKGIIHQTSCVESPQQNKKVERKHEHVLNMSRTLIFQSKHPKQYWSYFLLHATYIINRVATTILENKEPYIVLNGRDLDLHTLKMFASLCYASTLHSHITKLEMRIRKCVFLGYNYDVKGAILLYLNNREHILPYKSIQPL